MTTRQNLTIILTRGDIIMKNLLGAHISIAGGLDKAIDRAEVLGIDCMQIFTKSNRSWNAKPLCLDGAKAFKSRLENSNIKEVIVHASYLINVASEKKSVEERSRAALIDELNRCSQLGIRNLVLHPGNRGGNTEDAGINKIALNINKALEQTESTKILLENMAGQGSSTAHSFENIAKIYEKIEDKDRVGACFDTCHAFAAGYDLKDNYEKIILQFDEIVGLEKLIAVHLNDSKKPLGSKVDRHENIGKGFLTEKAFKNIMLDKRLANKIKILETPIKESEQEYAAEINRLTALCSTSAQISAKEI